MSETFKKGDRVETISVRPQKDGTVSDVNGDEVVVLWSNPSHFGIHHFSQLRHLPPAPVVMWPEEVKLVLWGDGCVDVDSEDRYPNVIARRTVRLDPPDTVPLRVLLIDGYGKRFYTWADNKEANFMRDWMNNSDHYRKSQVE